MNVYKVLLFDINGTLMDYWNARNKALKEVVKQTIDNSNQKLCKEKNVLLNIKRIKQIENELRIQGYSIDELRVNRFSRWICENFGIQMNTSVNRNISLELNKKYTKLTDEFVKIFPDVKETLKKLNNAGFKLVIISNGPASNQMRRLKKCGIQDCFSEFIFSEEIGVSKPSKLFYDYIFKNVIEDKKYSLVVGDNVTEDIEGAVSYGLDAVWINRSGQTNNLEKVNDTFYEISTLVELCNLIFIKE